MPSNGVSIRNFLWNQMGGFIIEGAGIELTIIDDLQLKKRIINMFIKITGALCLALILGLVNGV